MFLSDQLPRRSSLICSMVALASGPSSMLQAVHGLQLGVGGDQETTPASTGLDSGNK